MSTSNAWAEFAGIFARTRDAHLEHEQVKAELRGLVPEDAKEVIGHGIRAKRSKSGAVSFDLQSGEGSHAAVQRVDCQLGGCVGQGAAGTRPIRRNL